VFESVHVVQGKTDQGRVRPRSWALPLCCTGVCPAKSCLACCACRSRSSKQPWQQKREQDHMAARQSQ
jgi:hypothetical protein